MGTSDLTSAVERFLHVSIQVVSVDKKSPNWAANSSKLYLKMSLSSFLK